MSTLMPQPVIEKPDLDLNNTALLRPKIASKTVLVVNFHAITLPEALDQVAFFIKQRIPRQLCFSNAHTVSLCLQNPALLNMINQADLVLADGMSIVWGARWLGIHIPCRLAGPDFMEALCAWSEESGHSIYLLGSTDENLMALIQVLKQRWPRIHLAGAYSPPHCDSLSEEVTQIVCEKVKHANPDILFVGMSCPKQEIWIHKNLRRLNVPVSLGVGAAFDFISGRIPRAPKFFMENGLEWLYRLYREPGRLWKRYLLGNAIFLSFLFKEMMLQFFSKPASKSKIEIG